MLGFLSRFSDAGYATLRIVAGTMFWFHGAQKIFGLFGKGPPPLFSQIWFGGVIELVCGLLIALGLVTRIAALLASGTMAVAYIQFHWKGKLDEGFFPIVNRGEMAVLYCFLFLYMALKGGGAASLDRVITGSGRSRA